MKLLVPRFKWIYNHRDTSCWKWALSFSRKYNGRIICKYYLLPWGTYWNISFTRIRKKSKPLIPSTYMHLDSEEQSSIYTRNLRSLKYAHGYISWDDGILIDDLGCQMPVTDQKTAQQPNPRRLLLFTVSCFISSSVVDSYNYVFFVNISILSYVEKFLSS